MIYHQELDYQCHAFYEMSVVTLSLLINKQILIKVKTFMSFSCMHTAAATSRDGKLLFPLFPKVAYCVRL